MADEIKEPQNLSKEVIGHLSKEIETITNNNNVFRSRASLSVFLGPFIVLGSFVIVLKGSHISFHPNTLTWILIGLAGLGFIGLGWMSGMVERHGWELCNRYRQLIARLHNEPQSTIEANDLVVRYKPRLTYLVVYGLMLLTFVCAVYVVSRLEIKDIPAKPVQINTVQPSKSGSESSTQNQ